MAIKNTTHQLAELRLAVASLAAGDPDEALRVIGYGPDNTQSELAQKKGIATPKGETPEPEASDDVLFTVPHWFSERVPFKGYVSRYTWGEMCDGSENGGRHNVLKWAVTNGPRTVSKYHTAIFASDVARAKVCLAVRQLTEAMEAASQFDF